MKSSLEAGVRLVRFEQGHIELQPLEGTPPDIVRELSEKLTRATGQRWVVSLAKGASPAAPTLKEQAHTREEALKASAAADPLVKAALAAFPGAVIVDVRDKLAAHELALPSNAPDEFPTDDELEID